MSPNKKSFILGLKSMIVTLCVFLFFTAMFIAMNESRRSIDGKTVFVSSNKNSVNVVFGNDIWVIEPDTATIEKLINWFFHHPSAVPPPFQFIDPANALVSDFLPEV